MAKLMFYFVIFLAIICLNECLQLKQKHFEPKSTDDGISKNLNRFAFKLHSALVNDRHSGNLIYSPFSIASVIALLSAGSGGKTRDEILEAFGWDGKTSDLYHVAFGKLLKRLTAKGAKRFSLMNIANRVWVEHQMRVEKKFRHIARDEYQSKVGRLDFENDPEYSRKTINEWVKKNTGQKITNFLKPGTIDAMTRMVITNAVYFKAVWKIPFNPKLTRTRKFHTTSNKQFNVKMMEANLVTNFVGNSNYSVLELPYKGQRFSMLVVLPETGKNIGDIESIIDADTLMNVENRTTRIKVYLPKFKVTSTRDLTESLTALKIRTIFGPGCDLSGMFKKPHGIFVTDAIHKAFIEVDERGTKAGAATAMISSRSFLPVFNANRPFLFYIKDNRSGVILFAGRFTNPE